MRGNDKERAKTVVIAKSAGFCFGVKRAIKMAFETCKEPPSGDIYTLGQIIHNPQVVEQLKERGVKMIGSVKDITCGTVIIRSHGLTKEEKDRLDEKDVLVIDATCPFVTKAQEYAVYLAEEGYTVIILGDKDHPEVKSIRSFVEGRGKVITDLEEIGKVKRRDKAGVVAQTTQTQENLIECVNATLEVFQEVRVFNTICSATAIRQKETVEIAKRVESLIIIGGFNSANTRRLAELAKGYNEKVHHIERAEQVTAEMVEGLSLLGVSAGASTPDWAIEQVIDSVKTLWGGGEVEILRGL